MNHTAYKNYFESKARRHFQLQHGAALPGSPTGQRVSFFRMNDGRELQQAIPGQVNYPCMLLPVYRGRLADSGTGIIRDQMTGFFEIRQDVSDGQDFAAIEEARARCKQIGFDIVAGMMRDLEETGGCGPMADFNPNTVQYDFTGPFNIIEYGCLFFFEFSDDAFNAVTQDLDEIFV